MAKTDAINVLDPAGPSDLKLGDDYIRTLARAVVELLTVDHYVGATNPYDEDAAGEHAKLTLRQTTKPPNVEDKGFLYTKDVSGTTELFYEDEAGNEKMLTVGGKLNIAATEAALLVGDQTIAGVKMFSSSPIVPTPTTDMQASTRKYADDLKIVPAKVTNIFGAWETKANNTEYTATTDGFVCAYSATSGGASQSVSGYTPTATLRVIQTSGAVYATSPQEHIMYPVRNGDTWKVTGATTVYWLPIGT